MNTPYPKRLIEVDLPIGRISAHSRREKSIRHGHISTLHIWWARRPLAACRAVVCAALWPDPADPLCPDAFRETARGLMGTWAADQGKLQGAESFSRFRQIQQNPTLLDDNHTLRQALLDFIADFADWDNSTVRAYLDTSRALTQAAHEALGGAPGTRPLVVDPFAGGGSIPLEALRVGADAFASDLNPIPVLLNKVVLEFIPKYGQRLADEVRKWGEWIKTEAEKELARFYPKDADGATPIAYLWARTIRCEGPGCGAEVPLIRTLKLGKKGAKSVSLRLLLNKRDKRIDFEIVEGMKEQDLGQGTIKKGSASCPICGYTTPNQRVRTQLTVKRGGAGHARMLAVVSIRTGHQGRTYRLPSKRDLQAVESSAAELRRRQASLSGDLNLVPDEPISKERPSPNARGLSAVTRMGIQTFGDLFSPRQLLALTTMTRLVSSVAGHEDTDLKRAVKTCLALSLSKSTDLGNSCTRWKQDAECPVNLFARQAIPIVWDFCETAILSSSSGSWSSMFDRTAYSIEQTTCVMNSQPSVSIATATAHPLPNDSARAFITDPPYYDAVPYSDLSDFFYVWLKRCLVSDFPDLFSTTVTPKDEEAIWNPSRIYSLTSKPKDKAFYESQMARALTEGRRVVAPSGVGVVVFAHKSTSGWEAILAALIQAGWIATASWPIDTEMGSRVNAMGTASLASSVHIVCRPRERPDGSVRMDEIGDWRDVLSELPGRIHEWMPRLASEGVVGADAIFACLGPALEIFSRYSRVEKSSGDVVPLREYLEHVWAAVSNEALSMIFKDPDAAGLEPDARLTAMWLWTLGSASPKTNWKESAEECEEDTADAGDEEGEKPTKVSGFVLEFDAARKIAQGLGIHLEKSPSIVEVKGDKARLLPVAERTKYLFGSWTGSGDPRPALDAPTIKRKPKKKDTQLTLFEALKEADADVVAEKPELKAPQAGSTVLDRVHQAMILFAAGRGEALKRFVVEEGIGKDARFWKLAQSLSALYPPGIDEKRWVDGVLARKKGLGF
ncbi:MAG: DUF1156 domain-containing protein [Isosphaerales bacterium]